MKRYITLLLWATVSSLNCLASGYYGSSSYSTPSIEVPGWLTFIFIVMVIWGILEIILFFKIWGMTDDIRALKNDYFNEKNFATQGQIEASLRKNLVLGDIEKVKKTILKNFIDDVETAFGKMKSSDYEKDEKGAYVLVNYKEKNLKESIRPYVEKLQKQFDMIGEEVPVYIKRMDTFEDYYCLFAEENASESKETPSNTSAQNAFSMSSNNEAQSMPLSEKTEEVGTQSTETAESKQSSNGTLYIITIPTIITVVFLIGVLIFHANYNYSDWWIEESTILVPAFIVYAVIMAIYYIVVKNMKKSAE